MKRYRIKNILKIIGDIFVPLLPGIICAGLCGASASLIAQMVPDYGSNTWAYTRLGKIVDKTPEEMEELLGNGDVTITLSKR